MTILALYSNKGGVGKTAAAVNLSYLAAQAGMRTLICDLDPQSSATFYFKVKPRLKRQARGFLKLGAPLERSIKGTDYPNLDLLPGDFSHRNLDITFNRQKRSKHRLAKVLKPLEDEYDLVIIDCLPTINILAENVFNAADALLVPIVPTTLSLRTHRQLLSFFAETGRDLNAVSTFFSMVERRKKLHQELLSEARQEFNGVFQTTIPYTSVIEKMGIERQPVPAFAPKSHAAAAYRSLWNEVSQVLMARAGLGGV
ncbi:MAG: AAA family ATPase [Anaerolineales bacterium]|nr:AAA family ATPase [Anaerolineales bacterium]